MNRNTRYFIGVLMVITHSVFSQDISSPYSSNGIGDLSFQGLPSNYAMGEVGIGSPTEWHINIQNPAYLTYNQLSSFVVGLNGDFRKYTKTTASDKNNALSLRYMALSFPIVSRGRWVTAFSLLPYSGVKYNTYAIDSINNTNSVAQFQGNGGLTRLSWSNGVKVAKNLSLGIKASYIFGQITNSTIVNLSSDSTIFNYPISYEEHATYSDFNLELGAAYKFKLGESNLLHLGSIYQLNTKLSGNRDLYFERQLNSGQVVTTQSIISNQPVTFEIPVLLGFGVAYERINKFKIGFDYQQQNWSQSKSINENEVFRNSSKFALGAEFVPDYQSINSYFKRASYRVGFNLTESPYILNSSKINDFGINFGASFPVTGVSSLDAAFKVGVRGTTKNDLIRENYFQVVLGATINDRWFIKRRYD